MIRLQSFQQEFVMLSQYIHNGTARVDQNYRTISLSHLQIPLIIDTLPKIYLNAITLNLTYCKMRTLKGIQQFEELQELNIKYNEIVDVGELYRIKNKDKIVRFEFVGNDLQYLGGAMFINLVKLFPNLIELNGRNYFNLIYQEHSKKHSLKRILAHSNRLQKQMAKTVKRQSSKHQQARIQYENQRNYSDQLSQNQDQQLQDEVVVHQNENNMNYVNRNKYQVVQKTSRRGQSISEESYYSQKGLKENKNFPNIPMEQNDISIGGISNIPMTKSVRGSIISNSRVRNTQKGKNLQIFTLNQSLQANKNSLVLPTATFAMQRQKQNMQPQLGFAFKQKRGTQKYSNVSIPIEQYDGYDKSEQKVTKRCTYGSLQEEQQQQQSVWSQTSEPRASIIGDPILINERQAWKIAPFFYQKSLLAKAFKGWAHIPQKRNLPMRLSFY